MDPSSALCLVLNRFCFCCFFMIINISQSFLTQMRPFTMWLTTVVQYAAQQQLTIQPSRLAGTQRPCRRRPARQSLSTASWWCRSAPAASCLPQWSLPSSAASVRPPAVSSTHIERAVGLSQWLICFHWACEVNTSVVWDLCTGYAEINVQHLHSSD